VTLRQNALDIGETSVFLLREQARPKPRSDCGQAKANAAFKFLKDVGAQRFATSKRLLK
jgi:hypothetical protein